MNTLSLVKDKEGHGRNPLEDRAPVSWGMPVSILKDSLARNPSQWPLCPLLQALLVFFPHPRHCLMQMFSDITTSPGGAPYLFLVPPPHPTHCPCCKSRMSHWLGYQRSRPQTWYPLGTLYFWLWLNGELTVMPGQVSLKRYPEGLLGTIGVPPPPVCASVHLSLMIRKNCSYGDSSGCLSQFDGF